MVVLNVLHNQGPETQVYPGWQHSIQADHEQHCTFKSCTTPSRSWNFVWDLKNFVKICQTLEGWSRIWNALRSHFKMILGEEQTPTQITTIIEDYYLIIAFCIMVTATKSFIQGSLLTSKDKSGLQRFDCFVVVNLIKDRDRRAPEQLKIRRSWKGRFSKCHLRHIRQLLHRLLQRTEYLRETLKKKVHGSLSIQALAATSTRQSTTWTPFLKPIFITTTTARSHHPQACLWNPKRCHVTKVKCLGLNRQQ